MQPVFPVVLRTSTRSFPGQTQRDPPPIGVRPDQKAIFDRLSFISCLMFFPYSPPSSPHPLLVPINGINVARPPCPGPSHKSSLPCNLVIYHWSQFGSRTDGPAGSEAALKVEAVGRTLQHPDH